jgi:hypothetical protein
MLVLELFGTNETLAQKARALFNEYLLQLIMLYLMSHVPVSLHMYPGIRSRAPAEHIRSGSSMHIYVPVLVNCYRVAIGVSLILSKIHGRLRNYSQVSFLEACEIKPEDEHARGDIGEVPPVIVMTILFIDEVDWIFGVDLCGNSILS